MKFDLLDPTPEESSSNAPASPEYPDPAPAEESEVSGVKGRYGHAVGSALSSLSQLHALVSEHPARQELSEHDEQPFDGDDSAQAVFRPDLFAPRSGGEQ